MLRVVGGRRVAHSFVPGPEQAPGPSPNADYDFLLGRYVDAATLARATMLAARSGVEPHEVLIAQGWLKPQAYYAALANHLGVPFEPRPDPARLQPPSPKATPRDCLVHGLMRERERAKRLVFGPDRMRPGALRQMLAQLPPLAVRVILAKGINEADSVLRTSITYRIVQAMRLQAKRGSLNFAGREDGPARDAELVVTASALELAPGGDSIGVHTAATRANRIAFRFSPAEFAERLVSLLFAHGIDRPERQGPGGGAEKEMLRHGI